MLNAVPPFKWIQRTCIYDEPHYDGAQFQKKLEELRKIKKQLAIEYAAEIRVVKERS